MPVLEVHHTIEMGHRLSKQPDSKCFHLHGHTWKITLWLSGPIDKEADWTIDFGEVKREFRKWLDETYDHKTLLNVEDELFKYVPDADEWGLVYSHRGDPTVENFAQAIYEWAGRTFPKMFHPSVRVQEGPINAITVGSGI